MKYAIAVALLCLPALACAQQSKTYMAFQADSVWLQNADNSAQGMTVQSGYKTGYGVAFRVGRQFARSWRLEWELAYAYNDVNRLTLKKGFGSLDGAYANVDGYESALSLMANALYDFMPDRPYHPYIGAGIGVTRLDMHNIGVNGVTLIDDTTAAFAYQGMVGVELDIKPQTAVYVQYHYFAAADPQFRDEAGNKFDSEYKSNNVSIGLRYYFQ